MKTDKEGVTTFNMYMMLGVNKKEKFRTGWQIDAGEETPRIITAFRNDKEK